MLWTFHSNLCFYGPNDQDIERPVYAPAYDRDPADDQKFDDLIKFKLAKFIDAVNGIIQRHSGIGINKFSIRCGLHKEHLEHLDRWIRFAVSSKADIIECDLKKLFWESKEVHHFPLEALDVQGNSCVQSLFLAHVSIKPHSGICGFTILRSLVLEHVQISGDFASLLANCSALEDFAISDCPANLAHFEYIGEVIPIVLHGCSKLKKATIRFFGDEGLGHAFTAVPSILPVKILNVKASIMRYEQLQKLSTRPHGMFMHLRHMNCELVVFESTENADNGVLQLACCLDTAPQLETLHLNMLLLRYEDCKSYAVVEEEGSHMHRHDHLKTVYISGFRLYKAQTRLACCILANASVLEHLTLEPRFGSSTGPFPNYGAESAMPEVCKWAHLASKRFGKVITVVDAPSE